MTYNIGTEITISALALSSDSESLAIYAMFVERIFMIMQFPFVQNEKDIGRCSNDDKKHDKEVCNVLESLSK